MKKFFSAGLFIMLTVCLVFSALAEGGTGDGGSSEPLVLESSSVPDGSTGVALDVKMTLTFSKNVVNMAVRDNNLTCFSLADSKGGAVGISVIMGDDQVDPTIKNNVEIKPKATLLPDTRYTLTISGNLTSKSGVTMGQTVALTFTTVGAPEASPTPSSTAVPSSSSPSMPATVSQTSPSSEATPASPSPTPGLTTPEASASDSTPVSSPDAAAETDQSASSAEPQISNSSGSAAEDSGNQQESPIPYILAGAAVIVIAGMILAIVRKKK